MRGITEIFLYTPYPEACIAFPVINITHQNGTFVTKDEPTSLHPKHLKSRVYLRAHSWCHISGGLGQAYNYMHPSLYYRTGYCRCSKCLLYSTKSSLQLPLKDLLYSMPVGLVEGQGRGVLHSNKASVLGRHISLLTIPQVQMCSPFCLH